MVKQRSKSAQNSSTKYNKLLDKDSADDDDDEGTELFVRRSRASTSSRRQLPTIDINVGDGDTLQSLAIRHHCTIEDLKRLNGIHRENEIFARNTVKVPHRPFAMALAGVHSSGTSSPINSTLPSTINSGVSGAIADQVNARLGQSVIDDNSEVNQIIFNSNIVQLKSTSSGCNDSDNDYDDDDKEEVIHLLQHTTSLIESKPPATCRFNCSGADGDISVIALVLCIAIVIFAVPLVYVFYIAEHPQQFHDHQHV